MKKSRYISLFLFIITCLASCNISGQNNIVYLPVKITTTNNVDIRGNSVEIFGYDSHNRLVSYENNTVDTTYYERLSIYYGDSGKIEKVIKAYRPHAKTTYEYLINYKENNNVEIMTESGMQFGGPTSYDKDYYTLDDDGRVVAATLEDGTDRGNKVVFVYDAKGNLLRREERYRREEYVYGNNSSVFKDVAAPNWFMHYFIKRRFHSNNNIEGERVYAGFLDDLPLFSKNMVDYMYNKAGYPVSYTRELNIVTEFSKEKYDITTIEYKEVRMSEEV